MSASAIPLLPDEECFARQCAQGNLIPVFAELMADYETPLSVYAKLQSEEGSFLLESAEKREDAGRYSIVGTNPRARLVARGDAVEIFEGDAAPRVVADRDPLAVLEDFMGQYQVVADERLPLFYGGAVGYLGYGMVRHFEPTVGAQPPDDLQVPDMVFLIADTVVIFDHQLRKMLLVANAYVPSPEDAPQAYAEARARIDALVAKLIQPSAFPLFALGSEGGELQPDCNTTREEYEAMVERSKDYIRAGDIFQVVPSQRFCVPYEGSPLDLYRVLRRVNPSPYMFCLQLPEGFSLVGSSPEVHVRCEEGLVEIRPLAGTRPRGQTPEEDDALAQDLLGDPKECAEHVMLLDLARNDVGRVSEYGSVKVTDFMIVERYSHVMHIVSHVCGKLAPGKSTYDVMRATFPAGTVSGSPKVRAMQIINELEHNARGTYSGAVGYFGFDGNLDSCIALRTVLLKDGKAYIQAGAGIVADSDPTAEYHETRNKARAIVHTLSHIHRSSVASPPVDATAPISP